MTPVTRRTAAGIAAAAALAAALSGCGSDSGSSSAAKKSPSASALPSVDPKSVPTTPPNPATDKDLAKLPNSLAKDGTTVVVGDPGAKNVLHILEDPRCPFCRNFELSNGAQLAKAAASGKLRIEYTLASFLDPKLGGGGSKRAVNALRAALEEKKFPQYHAAVYEGQPDEQTDGFTNAYLLKLGAKVPGLVNASFSKAVASNTYADFTAKSEKAFESSGAQATPTAKLNGKTLPADDLAPAKLAAQLQAVGAR